MDAGRELLERYHIDSSDDWRLEPEFRELKRRGKEICKTVWGNCCT